MKQIYKTLALVLFSGMAFAQNYTLNPGNVTNEVITTNSYFVTTINMDHNNVTPDMIELQWELIDKQVNTDWDFSFCDYTNCYTGIETSGTMVPFGNNQSGFIKVNLMAPSIGSGYFKFRVYETGDAANADTLTFNYNVVLGIEDNTLGASVKMYPNPSNGGMFYINNIEEGTKVSILNSLGQEVYSSKASSKLALDVSSFNKGLYFVRLEKNNTAYVTRKVVIK